MKTHIVYFALVLVLAGGCVSRRSTFGTVEPKSAEPVIGGQTVEIMGTVIHGGVYPWREGMTLTQGLAIAGGATRYAGSVSISRQADRVTFTMKQLGFGADLPLLPGDRVMVDPIRAH